MDTVQWIIFLFMITPPLLGLIGALIYFINLELAYRKQDKIDRVEAMERTYRDCLVRLEKLGE